jgi:AcrR family transcriptional regulator
MSHTTAARKRKSAGKPERPIRERVLAAAFAAFRDRGYAGASTLEIATRAHVSKRELYALFDSKQTMLAACIDERARQMRLPLELPSPTSRAALAATLVSFGMSVLRGVCDPNVLAVYRLAIGEWEASPELARTLDRSGREANWAALTGMLTEAQGRGLIGQGEPAVDPAVMAARFFALLWGDLLVRLLLGVTGTPAPAELESRARAAAEAMLTFFPGATDAEAAK